ncbi:MAG: nucleoside deaminase [Desulfobacteraceae bacterium]|nr:nucleoside deaminase [Desulfobacteraceae bacterium]
MPKTIWNALGDIRLAVILLLAASATLLTGSFYAEDHFSLFMALNHMRIQDWLPPQWASQPALVWWIPVLFAIMALLGINTFVCAANRCLRLFGQRRSMARGRFFYLLTPSLVHFLFITIMLGHLATFTAGRWQSLPLAADSPIAVSREAPVYRVETIQDECYPDTSALGNRLRQTAVTLAGAGGQTRRLQYGQPAFIDGRFLFIDKAPRGKIAHPKPMPAGSPPARRPGPASAEAAQGPNTGQPLLLIVSDPGLAVIIFGLTLIMALMIGYFLFKSRSAKWIAPVAILVLLGAHPAAAPAAESRPEELAEIEARIEKLRPDPAFHDDRYGLIAVSEALTSLKDGSGGIGACLVHEQTGEVVCTGRNRQYRPYFRSDLHAEMDLLNRYEDWLRKMGGSASGADPRNCAHLVLVSSVEPCPMCLTRIINSGIKKLVYVTPDERGGMVSRMDRLPPFWQDRARDCNYRLAVCSPAVRQLAGDLFDFSIRTWDKKKEETK